LLKILLHVLLIFIFYVLKQRFKKIFISLFSDLIIWCFHQNFMGLWRKKIRNGQKLKHAMHLRHAASLNFKSFSSLAFVLSRKADQIKTQVLKTIMFFFVSDQKHQNILVCFSFPKNLRNSNSFVSQVQQKQKHGGRCCNFKCQFSKKWRHKEF